MPSAAFLLLRLLLTLIVPVGGQAASSARRSAPTRPTPSRAVTAATRSTPVSTAAVPSKKLAGRDYVSVADVAARLGLTPSWIERGSRLRLVAGSDRTDLKANSREATVNGLRVFLGDAVLESGGQLYVSRVDYERCLTPLLRPSLGAAAQPSPKTIVLDPGHGGKDNGTSVKEKTYALDVAKRTKSILQAAGYTVVLTREGDTYVGLTQRTSIANARRAGLFVSIHFNAVPNDSRTSGVEVFTFAPRTQHAASWWGLSKKDDPHLEMKDMPVNRFDHWSVVLAQALHRRLVVDLKSFDRGKKLAHWGVLRQLDCPGVLLECGFLTSSVEAKKIATAAHRQKLAAAIAAGIRDYAAAGQKSRARSSAAAASLRRKGSVRF